MSIGSNVYKKYFITVVRIESRVAEKVFVSIIKTSVAPIISPAVPTFSTNHNFYNSFVYITVRSRSYLLMNTIPAKIISFVNLGCYDVFVYFFSDFYRERLDQRFHIIEEENI